MGFVYCWVVRYVLQYITAVWRMTCHPSTSPRSLTIRPSHEFGRPARTNFVRTVSGFAGFSSAVNCSSLCDQQPLRDVMRLASPNSFPRGTCPVRGSNDKTFEKLAVSSMVITTKHNHKSYHITHSRIRISEENRPNHKILHENKLPRIVVPFKSLMAQSYHSQNYSYRHHRHHPTPLL